MAGANTDFVSSLAMNRGMDQVGTLGSGNHFLEIQVVDVTHYAGISKKAVRLRPLGVLKG